MQAVDDPERLRAQARWLPALAMVILAACGGGSGHSSSTTAPATTTARTPGSSSVAAPLAVRAATAGWHLPAPLTRPAVAVVGDRALLLGGLTRADTSTPQVVAVDHATGGATVVGALSEAVHDAAGATLGGSAVVFGGGAARTVDAVQTFTGSSGRVTAHLPRPRSDLAAASVGGTAYIVGGFDGSALSPDVLATTDGIHFRTIGRLAQGVRYPAVAAVGHDLWVLGGQTGTSEGAAGTEVDLIQRFDTETGTATVVGHMPQRFAHAMAFALGAHLYVAGGRTASAPLDDILAVSPDGAVASIGRLPGPRADAGVATVGGTVLLLGGETTGPTAALSSVVIVSTG